MPDTNIKIKNKEKRKTEHTTQTVVGYNVSSFTMSASQPASYIFVHTFGFRFGWRMPNADKKYLSGRGYLAACLFFFF